MLRDLNIMVVSTIIAITVTTLMLQNQIPKIVVIDNNKLMQEFIISIGKNAKSDDPEELKKQIHSHENKLEEFNLQIVKIAQEQNLVILAKESIIAGGEEQTEEARELLRELLKKESRQDKEGRQND